jgi:hypothetical protein
MTRPSRTPNMTINPAPKRRSAPHPINDIDERLAFEPVAMMLGNRSRRATRPNADCCGALGQLAETHPINPPVNHDLSMLAIADIATENTGATFPQDRHAGLPDRADLGGG